LTPRLVIVRWLTVHSIAMSSAVDLVTGARD